MACSSLPLCFLRAQFCQKFYNLKISLTHWKLLVIFLKSLEKNCPWKVFVLLITLCFGLCSCQTFLLSIWVCSSARLYLMPLIFHVHFFFELLTIMCVFWALIVWHNHGLFYHFLNCFTLRICYNCNSMTATTTLTIDDFQIEMLW